MCLAVLMVQLDTTVVNLALRPIQISLHTGVTTLQWVVDAYNLVYATFILTGAILGDRFGRKRLFLAGVALFGLGSVLSAVAPGATVLVLSRVVTGLGAAIALPISLSIVSATYSDEKERNHENQSDRQNLQNDPGPRDDDDRAHHCSPRVLSFVVCRRFEIRHSQQ